MLDHSRHRSRTSLAAVSVLALALGGCMLGPGDEVVADAGIPVPTVWSEAGNPELAVNQARYWEALGDPVLAELVELALENNLDLAQAATRLIQARESLDQARASFLPQVSAGANSVRAVGDGSTSAITTTISANASWEIDLFGSIGSSARAASFDYEASGYDLADLQRAIAGQVAQQVINARSTSLQLAIARDTLSNQNENLQIARWRNQAGLVSSLDVEQARSQRAQTAASIPSLESSLASTANAISTLIGEPPGRVHALLSEPADLLAPPELGGLGAPADILRRRPDVRAAEVRLLSDSARIGVARAQLFPALSLSGNIGTGDLGALNLFDMVTGTVTAGINQLLFDGGRTQSRIRAAEAVAEGSLAAWQKSILTALEEVESAIIARRSTDRRLVELADALDAANNAAILARSQYQAGLTDFQTLLSSESQLLSARNSMVSARADRANAFIRLTQALGGGWNMEQMALGPDNRNTP